MWEIQWSKAILYTVAIKDENDQINPQIVRREKVDWKTVLTPVKWLQGYFEKVELSTYHSDALDKDVENINIYLWDKDWEYRLSTAWTTVWRSLLNTLAWEKELGELTIKVYGKEKDGKIRARVSLYNNWQMTNWKLSVEEQKKLIEPITKKDWTFVSNDYSELDNTLKWFIEEINKKASKVKDPEKFMEEKLSEEELLPF